MKKLAIIVSIICAFLFTAMGIKSVSATGIPSYCVLIESDYGISDEDTVMQKLNEKVVGDMIPPETTRNAMADVVADGKGVDELSVEELQKIATYLACDYVVIVRVYNDTEYDDLIHNVECSVDIMDAITGNEVNRIGNVLVAKGETPADENSDAMTRFIGDMGAVSMH